MKTNRFLFYYSCAILGVYTQLSWEIFNLATLPCLFFVFALFLLAQKEVKFLHIAPLFVMTIGLILFLNPSNYIFTFLMLFALVLFLLTQVTKSLLPQALLTTAFLAFLFVKPGYVLVFIMHYQRLMSSMVG